MKTLLLLALTFVSTMAFANPLLFCRNSDGVTELIASRAEDGSIRAMSLEKPIVLVKKGIPRHPETDEYLTVQEGVVLANNPNSQLDNPKACDQGAVLSLEMTGSQGALKLDCQSTNDYLRGTYEQQYYTTLTCE